MSQTSLIDDIAEFTGLKTSSQIGSYAIPANLFPAKSRIALIGTVGAGKSTVVGGIGITAETLVRAGVDPSRPSSPALHTLAAGTHHRTRASVPSADRESHRDRAGRGIGGCRDHRGSAAKSSSAGLPGWTVVGPL